VCKGILIIIIKRTLPPYIKKLGGGTFSALLTGGPARDQIKNGGRYTYYYYIYSIACTIRDLEAEIPVYTSSHLAHTPFLEYPRLASLGINLFPKTEGGLEYGFFQSLASSTTLVGVVAHDADENANPLTPARGELRDGNPRYPGVT